MWSSSPPEPVTRSSPPIQRRRRARPTPNPGPLLKGTPSGGAGGYDAGPRLVPNATKYDEVSYIEVMTKDLKVMDATAVAFCRDNKIPIVVFDMSAPGALEAIMRGGPVGTIICDR